jgi:hypothetical protein
VGVNRVNPAAGNGQMIGCVGQFDWRAWKNEKSPGACSRALAANPTVDNLTAPERMQ